MEKAKQNIATLEQEIRRIENLISSGQIDEAQARRKIFITRIKIDRLKEIYQIEACN
jgi:multidrug resistance efflux pump